MPIDPERRFQLVQAFCPPGTSKYLQPRWYEPGELTAEEVQTIPPNFYTQPDIVEAPPETTGEAPPETTTTESPETRRRRSPAPGATGE